MKWLLEKLRNGCRVESRGLIETLAMRMAFAVVVFITFPNPEHIHEFTTQSDPSGIARFINLTFLSDLLIYRIFYWVAAVGLLFYAFGVAMPVGLGLVTVFHILTYSLKNSQGSTTHTMQIVSLVLLTQWVVYLIAIFRKKTFSNPKFTVSDWSIHFATHIIIGTYVVAGAIKLIRSRGIWIWDSPDIGLELLKSNAQRFNDYLQSSPLNDRKYEIANWMIDHPWLTRLLLGGGFLLELLAFLALVNRKTLLVGGILLVSLHVGIESTMGLRFQFNNYLLWIFLINIPFWSLWILGKSRGKGGAVDLRREPDFPYARRA
ncbi:MAG: hypothetical protein HKN23_10005 [Verrucomicrobiales bacterium]|nr:hypothetical protein [Verrucomicrobiales bacterium]